MDETEGLLINNLKRPSIHTKKVTETHVGEGGAVKEMRDEENGIVM
jgi:hypothetical protein